MSVLVETSFGDITIDLNTEQCRNASFNFLKLCKIKHYNNSLFMKVQKDFITQITTQKPTTAWQQLNLKYDNDNTNYFKDEIDMEKQVKNLGLLLTSNTGPNLNNSEFCITLTKAHLSSLDGKHTIFGKVQEGYDVLKKINQTIVDSNARPQLNIRILHTHILFDPFDDPQNLQQIPSPQLKRNSDRLQAIEHLQMLEKYQSQNDIAELTRKQKAKKQAVTLQMLGDLPDANIKPPQNILFVCKLNPITQQRDLQIIFSRFGPVKSVQIVRDWKTGQSLQYGFIQFQSQKSCEQAYLKMDNVLIDDRRIHVDFSQSVSKFMPRKKNKIIYNPNQPQKNNRQLVLKMKDQKNYHGSHKYDIVSKDMSRHHQNINLNKQQMMHKKQRQQSYDESSLESESRSVEKKKKKKQKKKKQKKSKRKYSKSPKKEKKYRDRSRSRNRNRDSRERKRKYH